MERYMIQAPHTQEDCVRALDAVQQAGAHYLRATDWGCYAGDHTSWLVVEALDDDDARRMVPPGLRKDVRVVRLNKFTPDDIRKLQQETGTL